MSNFTKEDIEDFKKMQGTRDCRHYETHPWAEHDGYGIFLTMVCDDCEAVKMATYRRDIHTAYDCDEQIEPEEY